MARGTNHEQMRRKAQRRCAAYAGARGKDGFSLNGKAYAKQRLPPIRFIARHRLRRNRPLWRVRSQRWAGNSNAYRYRAVGADRVQAVPEAILRHKSSLNP